MPDSVYPPPNTIVAGETYNGDEVAIKTSPTGQQEVVLEEKDILYMMMVLLKQIAFHLSHMDSQPEVTVEDFFDN